MPVASTVRSCESCGLLCDRRVAVGLLVVVFLATARRGRRVLYGWAVDRHRSVVEHDNAPHFLRYRCRAVGVGAPAGAHQFGNNERDTPRGPAGRWSLVVIVRPQCGGLAGRPVMPCGSGGRSGSSHRVRPSPCLHTRCRPRAPCPRHPAATAGRFAAQVRGSPAEPPAPDRVEPLRSAGSGYSRAHEACGDRR